MFVSLPAPEASIDAMINAGQYNDALANILVTVHNHTRQPETARQFLFYPVMDTFLDRLSQALHAQGIAPGSAQSDVPVTTNTLIIASDLMEVGGHSRVIVDCARNLPQATIVVTDMFWQSHKNPERLQWLIEQLPDTPVLVLPQSSLWGKCLGLKALVERLSPRNILYFHHHEDPIPFVGTLGHSGSRKSIIHHCDHNASLGNTLSAMHHVDFTQEMADSCGSLLQRATQVLPLYVDDAGAKNFTAPNAGHFSVVTAGADHKFARQGELSFFRIAKTVLSLTSGMHYHIGAIDAQWVSEIQQQLTQEGIDGQRFVALGSVPSLWGTLAQLDAHLYLGSAPVGGGRGSIEAQGCGYPTLYFKVQGQGPALDVDSIYASPELGWRTLPELRQALLLAANNHAHFSGVARRHYEAKYSKAEFLRVLASVVC
jgi:hypothetical protein